MTAPPTIIRPSGLPQWPDCKRRSFARGYPKLVEQAGYELRPVQPSIGAVVGTATHAAMQHAMVERMAGREAQLDDLAAAADEALSKEMAAGVVWDDTTRNRAAAQKQAYRQALAILQTAARDVVPVATEEELDADIGDGFLLRGHIDLRDGEPSGWDWKTGTVMRANLAQYGGYSMLIRVNIGKPVKRLREVYIKRVGETKPQPDPVVIEYTDVPLAEKMAWQAIVDIKDTVQRFRETGDAWETMPNPNSLMCSEDYCPAWGTAFCTAHKQKLPE